MMFACNVVLPDSQFEVTIHLTFAICFGTWPFGQRGLGSNRARSLPDLQVVAMWSHIFLQVYYALPNKIVGYDVACQVGKGYNICPPASWSFHKGMDTIIRSNLNLYLWAIVTWLMLQALFGVLNVFAIMLCMCLGRSFQFQMQLSLQFMSHASRRWPLQLLRVEAIIMTAFDYWIDIRHSGLFSFVGWRLRLNLNAPHFM